MSTLKSALIPVVGLLASLCFVGTTSLAFADDDDDDDKGPGKKVTICHIPTQGMSPKTLRLSAQAAQRHLQTHPNDFTGVCGGTKFALVAVSGTLEEGFPLRPNLDFTTEVNEGNPAVLGIFLGHALVRGVRAFLDIKDSFSREFVAGPPGLNPINPGLVASGNNNDANISSLYLVDRRQAARALLREPRYLSMVPDLAKVDIHAAETDPDVRNFILQAIEEDTTLLEPKNTNQVTLLQVISTWKSCHFVPSPVLYTKPDGARVTDFPNSLAAFAGVTDALRTSNPGAYNAAVDAAVRAKLALPPDQVGSNNCIDNPSSFLNPAAPDTVIRYGVDKSTKRMNDVYRPCQLKEFAARAGVNISVKECPN